MKGPQEDYISVRNMVVCVVTVQYLNILYYLHLSSHSCGQYHNYVNVPLTTNFNEDELSR